MNPCSSPITESQSNISGIETAEHAFLSVIIPVFNEEENCEPLFSKLKAALDQYRTYEVIFVDDGSTDGTSKTLDDIADCDSRYKVIHFRRNFGQTAAMMAGINYASGEIIVPMDGDLQNDPLDIPPVVAKLDEGYDVCSGWRKDRKDNPIKRNLPSKVANAMISFVSGVKLNDYGCTLKAYRRSIIKDIKLYGEMHRFIPVYASWLGARVTQVPVQHHPRIHGKSKYGIKRTIKVILDLMVVKFLMSYLERPIYVFGGFGLLNFLLSFLTAGVMIYFKFWGGKSFIQTPLPMLTVLFVLMGFVSILIGFVAELLMRTYYESQHKSTYLIHNAKNLEYLS